jgi:hypothetical protein
MVGKCIYKHDGGIVERAHTAAVTAWTPVYIAGLGVCIPQISADANPAVKTTFYVKGVFRFAIDTSITVTQGDRLWYDGTATKVQKTIPAVGFLLGLAMESGTAVAGYVDVSINAESTPAKIYTPLDVADTANTLTAEQVLGGVIYGIMVTARTQTLPSAAELWALAPGAAVGSAVDFTVVNCGADSDVMTVAVPASITNKGTAAHLTVGQNAARTYRIIFTSATAADIYPLS